MVKEQDREDRSPLNLISFWILGLVILSLIAGFVVMKLEPGSKKSGTPSAGENSDGTDASALSHSSKYNVLLKPFHWDFEFQTVENRDAFLAAFSKKKSSLRLHFESPAFLVFSADHETTEAVLKDLGTAGAGLKDGGGRPSHLPDYSGAARVSLALGIPQSRMSKTLYHHWHLKFEFPNRFTLKENLRGIGTRFLYEAPELWVLEIQGQDFDRLKQVIKDTHGLSANIGDAQFLSTEAYQKIPVRMTLYIEEG